jgi:PAS domain S-box-containing protein
MGPPRTPELLASSQPLAPADPERALASLQADAAEAAALRVLLSATGPSFFRSLLTHLSRALGADFAFISVPSDDRPGAVHSIAVIRNGVEAPDFEYELKGSPCEFVFNSGGSCVYPRGVTDQFPADACLRAMQIEGYAGTALVSSDGRTIGILGVLRSRPLDDEERTRELLELFAVRTSAELERQQADEKLRRSEMLLRSILDHSTSAIYVKDAQGRYLIINREFERIMAIPVAEALGKSPSEYLPSEDAARIQSHEDEVLAMRRPVRKAGPIVLPRIGERAYIVDKAPLFDHEGALFGTCTIATDVTEQKRLEAQLVRSQRLESIGQLAGGVAHDFNNLLTAITGYTSLALDGLPEGHPARMELGEALKAGERAAALTKQLLAFARKQVIQPRDVDLGRLVAEMRGLMKPVLGEDVRFGVHLEPNLWSLHVDPGQLEQVLMNLCINARDAMPDGGTIEITASNLSIAQCRSLGARTLPAGDYVEIRVTDTGTGVPEAVRPHLFEPFYTTKGAGKGTGLGLATCHGIVLQSGGHIEYEPNPPKGSTFIVLLPRGVTHVPVVLDPGALEGGRGSETVLVVEDESLVRELAVRALSQAGFQVLQAADGHQALARAREHTGTIHLLLTDVVMPGMNGLELATTLKRERTELRVMLMSGYPDAALAQRGEVMREEWPLLRKPYTPRELSARVRDVLDRLPV